MTSIWRWTLIAGTALLLAACATYARVESGSTKEIGDISVRVVGDWSEVNSTAVPLGQADAVWTVDGLNLNRLIFLSGIEPGEALEKTGKEEIDEKMPTFRAGMTETGVMELVEATFARSPGVVRAKASGLRPSGFLGRQGFAFEVDIVNASQIELKVLSTGVVVGNKLYMIYFAAPRLHFYTKELPTVRAIMDSARLSGGDA